jgi:DNA-binding CsgD family transcriptional regulator
MTAPAGVLELAHASFDERRWATVAEVLAPLAADGPLGLDDLERLAISARLCNQQELFRSALQRLFADAAAEGRPGRAAWAGYWLGHALMFEGEGAQASGWFARSRRLLEEAGVDCVEAGYLMVPGGIELIEEDPDRACATFRQAGQIARRFADRDLAAIVGHGLGRALIRAGHIAEGMQSLDEVMVAFATQEVSPLVVGDVYCGAMEACAEVRDLGRAREWTRTLTAWCEQQPDLVPYRGPCLVFRTELMQIQGAWEDAMEEALRACDYLSRPSTPEAADGAYYQLGELHRLRGEYDRAEEAYREARRLGHLGEPGLTLLRLAWGNVDSARASIERVLQEVPEPGKRSVILEAAVQILLAAGDHAAADRHAAELAAIASDLDTPAVRAAADHARGAVRLATGEPGEALAPLRRAWMAWQRLEAPYLAARVRVLIGSACRDLGDAESAEMEFDAARWVFQQLGAAPDLAAVNGLSAVRGKGAGLLSGRELEVVRLVAAGHTNREIANALFISEHTVARHIQNIFAKLGVSSRTALAGYAFEHRLLGDGEESP